MAGPLAHWGLRLRFAGDAMHEAIGPAFSHLEKWASEEPRDELTICVWDGRSTGVQIPSPPWGPEDVRELGQIRGFNDARFSTTHDVSYGAITFADRETSTAYFQVSDPATIPWYERAAPLRAALRALTTSPAAGLMHAGCIGAGGDGVVIAGPSGSGKSTLAAAALDAGLDLVGDDYVLFTLEPEPLAHLVHSQIKLNDASMKLLPSLAEGVIIPADPEWGEWGKHVVDPEAVGRGRLVDRLRIRGIVLPARSTGAPRLESVSGGAGLLALAPSTTFQLPPLDGYALAGLAELARDVPSYALHTGDDPEAAVGLVGELVADG